MSEVTPARRKTSENPRTTRVRKIVIDAATSLFVEEGHRAVTPQRVSQVTGVARSTIYRHWPDRETLLRDTIDVIVLPHATLEVTGELGIDLEAALGALRRRLDRRPVRSVFSALLEHADRSRTVVQAQRRFVAGVLAPLREIVDGAVERGELHLSVSADEAAAQLAGPLLQQHIMLRARITDALIAATVRGFLAANGRLADQQ